MSIHTYRKLSNEFEVAPLVNGLTRSYNRAFKTKRSKYHTRLLLNKRILSGKEELFINVHGTVITGHCRVFKANKRTTPFRLGRYSKTEDYGFISDFCSRMKGTGSKLMAHILHLSEFKDKDIILTLSNRSLLGYYKRFGFVPVDARKRVMVNNVSSRFLSSVITDQQ